MKVDIEHKEGSQEHYSSVIVQAFDYPNWNSSITDDTVMDIRRHGLTTVVKVHVENDEHVTPEVGYEERLRYPSNFSKRHIRFLNKYSLPLPAQELIETARTGLDMLKAYQEASPEQQNRIDGTLSGFAGGLQIAKERPRRDMDEYIALASPLLGAVMRQKGISFNHVGTKAIYALNVLNKVTDVMLPSQMPSAPQNRKEPARRKRLPGR